mgnify:CR=1 FL=1
MKTIVYLAITSALFTLAACGEQTREITASEAAVLGWKKTDRDKQDLTCFGILVNEPGWMAAQFRKGGFTAWDAAAAGAAIEKECGRRG